MTYETTGCAYCLAGYDVAERVICDFSDHCAECSPHCPCCRVEWAADAQGQDALEASRDSR